MELKLETTQDGTKTFYLPQLNEHYHSTKGALNEALHVFINSGLLHHPSKHLNILEVGFGTGLNAFLTLLETQKDESLFVNYNAIELFPLSSQHIRLLNYPQLIAPDYEDAFHQLHDVEWNEDISITSNFSLHKIESDLTKDLTTIGKEMFDVVYFDAFGPNKQPEMWSEDIFIKIKLASKQNCIIVTYSSKGSVRRIMQDIGLIVEKIPGPPGKREMLRATKP